MACTRQISGISPGQAFSVLRDWNKDQKADETGPVHNDIIGANCHKAVVLNVYRCLVGRVPGSNQKSNLTSGWRTESPPSDRLHF